MLDRQQPRQRKINFTVRERIVPGSVLGIIPFISEAIAHLTALPNFEEKSYLFIEDAPLDYPDFEWAEYTDTPGFYPDLPSHNIEPAIQLAPIEEVESVKTLDGNFVVEIDQRASLPLEYIQNNQENIFPSIKDKFCIH